MRVVREVARAQAFCACYRTAGLSVGYVATLGALHRGHLELVRRAREECDRVVVSIFVNPTQFNSEADFVAYPRTEEADLEACERAGVSLTFVGRSEDIYSAGFATWVNVERLTEPLCGASRPGHFRGVATVVTQLLSMLRPHRAYFGQKDFQQIRVVSRLVSDLHLAVDVRVVPTVRESDGLALSSRNRRLDERQREAATSLYRSLKVGRERLLAGVRDVVEVRAAILAVLSREPAVRVDYAEVRDAETLQEFPDRCLSRGAGRVLLAVAATLGDTRLIDNLVVDLREV